MATVEKSKAIVLLSGGLDSATCLALAAKQAFDIYALTFRYGQCHSIEIEAAKRLARGVATEHKIVDLPLQSFTHSSLLGHGVIPTERSLENIQKVDDIPSTYVPARNIIFLSMASSWAESIGAEHIFFGANSIDYSGYPDCRPEFIGAYEKMLAAGTKQQTFRIHVPLLRLTKEAIVQLAEELKVPIEYTRSCYQPSDDGRPCGGCDSCLLRRKGFALAGINDKWQPIQAAI